MLKYKIPQIVTLTLYVAPATRLYRICLLFSVFRGEVYKSLSHILTDFKKRLAIPYGKGKQNECQYPFPDKMS